MLGIIIILQIVFKVVYPGIFVVQDVCRNCVRFTNFSVFYCVVGLQKLFVKIDILSTFMSIYLGIPKYIRMKLW